MSTEKPDSADRHLMRPHEVGNLVSQHKREQQAEEFLSDPITFIRSFMVNLGDRLANDGYQGKDLYAVTVGTLILTLEELRRTNRPALPIKNESLYTYIEEGFKSAAGKRALFELCKSAGISYEQMAPYISKMRIDPNVQDIGPLIILNQVYGNEQ